MKTYNKLWKDVCEGLKTQGYEPVGGNDSCYLIMRNPSGMELKIFLHDYDYTNLDDYNFVVARFI